MKITRILRQKLIRLFVASLALLTPLMAFAADDETPQIDARLQGYKDGSMALKDASSAGMTWLIFVALVAVCVGILFMNSKRSHLD